METGETCDKIKVKMKVGKGGGQGGAPYLGKYYT